MKIRRELWSPSMLHGDGGASGGRICPHCGAVFVSTRWQWLESKPSHAESLLCPACRRIRDGMPAGTLTLRGPYCRAHRSELLAKVHDTVAVQSAEHPLRRLLAVVEQPDAVEVSFTDGHLPEIVGEALRQSFAGELEFDASGHSGVVRVSWEH